MQIKVLLLESATSFPQGNGQAGIAQLVEHKLPKLGVAGSNPVARSSRTYRPGRPIRRPGLFCCGPDIR